MGHTHAYANDMHMCIHLPPLPSPLRGSGTPCPGLMAPSITHPSVTVVGAGTPGFPLRLEGRRGLGGRAGECGEPGCLGSPLFFAIHALPPPSPHALVYPPADVQCLAPWGPILAWLAGGQVWVPGDSHLGSVGQPLALAEATGHTSSTRQSHCLSSPWFV